jgi:hypothetical protein
MGCLLMRTETAGSFQMANKTRTRFLQKVHGERRMLGLEDEQTIQARKESNARAASAVDSTTQKRRAIAELDTWILEATRQQYNQILKGKSSLCHCRCQSLGSFRPPRSPPPRLRFSLTTEKRVAIKMAIIKSAAKLLLFTTLHPLVPVCNRFRFCRAVRSEVGGLD